MTEGHEDYLGDLWDLLPTDPTDFLENPPIEDEGEKAPTSEWAFDHNADVSRHHTKFTNAEHDLVARHPLAVLDPLICSEAEAAVLIGDHAGLPNSHHAQAHDHDGDVLKADGINSNVGAFPFDTTGVVTFNQQVVMPSSYIATGLYARRVAANTFLGPNADSLSMYFLGGSGTAGEGAYCVMRGGDFGGAGLGGGITFYCSVETGANNVIAFHPGGSYGMGMNKLGHVGIHTPIASIEAKLDIDQFNAAGNIPVLKLDQADLGEAFIQLESAIAVGNPLEAKGAKNLTTTHFIKVELPGGLMRYLEIGTIA